MDKWKIRLLINCAVRGIVWAIIPFAIGLVIINFTSYDFKDVLFIESLILIVVGVASLNSGKPMGLSLQGLGQNNAQYIANANLQISRMENEKRKYNLKSGLKSDLNIISLIIGSVICIIIVFIT